MIERPCTGFLGTGKYPEERDGQQWRSSGNRDNDQQLLAGNVFVLSGLAGLAAPGMATVLALSRAAPGVLP